MDNNMAALIRNDTKTIKVQFGASKHYTYVTNLDVRPGDFVVVQAGDEFPRYSVGEITQVDTDCEIEPNSDLEYKWIVHAFNLEEYLLTMARNKEIETMVSKASRGNMRRTFAESILAGVDPEQRKAIEDITSVKPAGAKRLKK